MPHKRFNKQVPAFKAGGRAGKMGGGMMKRPMMKKGGSFMSASSTDKRKISGRGGGADSGKAGEARSKAGVQEVKIKKGIKNFGKALKDTVTLKKFHDAAKKAYQKSLAEGKTNRGTAEDTKNIRVRRKMGGSLKPVDPKTQKGLSKLPTEVRNKMGYMKEGGKVKGKRNFKNIKEIENYTKQAIASLEGVGDSIRDRKTPMKLQRLKDKFKIKN